MGNVWIGPWENFPHYMDPTFGQLINDFWTWNFHKMHCLQVFYRELISILKACLIQFSLVAIAIILILMFPRTPILSTRIHNRVPLSPKNCIFVSPCLRQISTKITLNMTMVAVETSIDVGNILWIFYDCLCVPLMLDYGHL